MAKNPNILTEPSPNGFVKQRVAECEKCKGNPVTTEKENYDYVIVSCNVCKTLVDFKKIQPVKKIKNKNKSKSE